MSRWDGAEPARLIGRIEGLERDMERIAQIAAGGELARLRNEVERLRTERDDAYRHILRHRVDFCGDHACRECFPRGEIAIDGFVCAVHRAKAALCGEEPLR